MSDRRYIVVCNPQANEDADVVYYQHCMPQMAVDGAWCDGFSIDISKAIVHTNPILAHLMCKEIAKIYTDFKIHVQLITTKELFKAKLSG